MVLEPGPNEFADMFQDSANEIARLGRLAGSKRLNHENGHVRAVVARLERLTACMSREPAETRGIRPFRRDQQSGCLSADVSVWVVLRHGLQFRPLSHSLECSYDLATNPRVRVFA
jgi:hypothetical protein